jgi:hypothetical protein
MNIVLPQHVTYIQFEEPSVSGDEEMMVNAFGHAACRDEREEEWIKSKTQ